MSEVKNENELELYDFFKHKKKYSKEWHTKKIKGNSFLSDALSTSSKSEKNNRGEPDLLYINTDKKFLILLENKDSIKDHKSKDGKKPQQCAVDGIKHYLKYFLANNLKDKKTTTEKYFKGFRIVGIAFSGDINDKYNHKISTYMIDDSKIIDLEIKELLSEEEYFALFENYDLEKITNDISKSSKKINTLLRNIDSQKRPVLISALMVCLYEKGRLKNDFKQSYTTWSSRTIVNNVPSTVDQVLKKEKIDTDKINVLLNELAFLQTDTDLNSSGILKDILVELDNNVIPLFNKQTGYDILGKFYEEFLRYAGIANVKKGIVLTPNHITKLFTKLIDLKTNDKIFDACCGTGAFLISGMESIINTIEDSALANKTSKIKDVKSKQLLGFEKSPTMYSLAISNMLFRGDGKSKIYNVDFFSDEAQKILRRQKPTIGFINPPYGGKNNKTNPTKKEIQFLEVMLDNVTRYGVIIAPLSTYFKDTNIRNRILSKHTLKAVINMPNELFAPNASTHTAIAIFETHKPHNDKKVVMYSLQDDGFVLSKNKGRTDVYNKWNDIEKNLLSRIEDPQKYNNNIDLIYKNIKKDDEWIIQAHSQIDYDSLNEKDFISTIKENIIFNIKREFDLLTSKIDEITFMEILANKNITNKKMDDIARELQYDDFLEFKISDLFDISKGERLTEADRIDGDFPLITASAYNNGITSFIDYDTFHQKKKIFRNKITVDMFGNTFYHGYKYFSDDNIHTLVLKEEQEISIYSNLFLVSLLKKISNKYGFGRQVRLHRLENEIIKLPTTKSGDPDWCMMEDYIKSLPYSASIENE